MSLPYGFKQYVNDWSNGCCGNNYLDRDYWNDTLLSRNFLVDYAPINNIMYPQSTGLCLERATDPFIEGQALRTALDERQYWLQNNSPQSVCPAKGVPLFTCPKKNLCKILNSETSKMTNNTGDRCIAPQQPDNDNSTDGLGPWTVGIKRNIDSDSLLKGVQFYNTRDCFENTICYSPNHELKVNQCQRDLYKQFFQDQDCIYPNYTPKWMDNQTRVKAVE
jgi:hypothetical protein